MAGAQQVHRVDGAVRRLVGGTQTSVSGLWVVLHRVARDTSGPLDSVRADGGGKYAFRFTPPAADSGIYFTSVMFAGVPYFTAPFTAPVVTGKDAEIIVYDTTSAGESVHTRSRHVIVFSAENLRGRRIAEVFWIENTGTRTRVAKSGEATWAAPLPEHATDVTVDAGDLAQDAVVTRNGRLEVRAPVAPGLRQLQISYTMPPDVTPLLIPLADTTMVFEVLLEDAGAAVVGPKLGAEKPVAVQQRNFQRFVANDVPPGSVYTITLPRTGPPVARGVFFGVVVGFAALALFGGLLFAARRRPLSVVVVEERDAASIARAIAVLDARHAGRTEMSDAERAEYTRERDRLKAELTAALADRGARS